MYWPKTHEIGVIRDCKMVKTKPCFSLLLRKGKKHLSCRVIKIVLYLNGVLHKTILNFRSKRKVTALCEYVIGL